MDSTHTGCSQPVRKQACDTVKTLRPEEVVCQDSRPASGKRRPVPMFSWNGNEQPEHLGGQWHWTQEQLTNVPPFWFCSSFWSWSLSSCWQTLIPTLTCPHNKGNRTALNSHFAWGRDPLRLRSHTHQVTCSPSSTLPIMTARGF